MTRVLRVLALLLACAACEREPATTATTAPPAATTTTTATAPAVLRLDGCVAGPYDLTRREVQGIVTNVSGAPLDTVIAVTTWFDASGEFVAFSQSMVGHDPLPPGQTTTFATHTRGPESRLVRYRVDFRTSQGEALSHIAGAGRSDATGPTP
jgi:hypothetical protein